jgi:hypothetical protein
MKKNSQKSEKIKRPLLCAITVLLLLGYCLYVLVLVVLLEALQPTELYNTILPFSLAIGIFWLRSWIFLFTFFQCLVTGILLYTASEITPLLLVHLALTLLVLCCVVIYRKLFLEPFVKESGEVNRLDLVGNPLKGIFSGILMFGAVILGVLLVGIGVCMNTWLF